MKKIFSKKVSIYNFSLVKQFSLLLFLALVVLGFLFGEIVTLAMRSDMVARSNEVAANYINQEVVNNLRKEDFAALDSARAYQEFSRQIAKLNLGQEVLGIKIWNRDMTVAWSSNREEIGTQSKDHHELDDVFSGQIISEIASEHHQQEKYTSANYDYEVMELYIPIKYDPDDKVFSVFEVYRNIDRLNASIRQHNRMIWLSIITGSLVVYLLLFGLVWRASRQLDKQKAAIGLSEDRYRSLVESAQDGIISADQHGRVVQVNDAAGKIFGYTASEMLTIQLSKLFVEGSQDPIKAELEKFFATGSCSYIGTMHEAEGVRKNGDTFPFEISFSVSGKDDNCLLTGLFRDIAERKYLMEQIATTKNQWEETFDTINDAITIHDKDFNIVRANMAAQKLLGLSLETVSAQKCFRSYHGQDKPPTVCPSCKTLESGIDTTTELYEPHLDKYLEIKALPRYGPQNELIGVIHVVRDISGRKKAEEQHEQLQEQLYQAQKMESVGRLAGGIAHDFNNMLSVIIGYSEIIKRGLPEESRVFQDVNTIKEAGEKAAVLTSQLLAFSRKQVLKMQPVEINSVVEGMVKMIARLIGEHIQLNLHLTSGIGKVFADRSQIEQVLLNLTVNARDAMPDGGECIVATSEIELDENYVDLHADAKVGRYILLAITDTGTGMSEDVRQHIFDPFFTTKKLGKGTGLGLATVYGIIKQHGGQIYVYSEPAKGTTFKVYLPIAGKTSIEKQERIVDKIKGGDETILIAEDDASISAMIKTSLESDGYTVLLASNGKEAVNICKSYDGYIHLLLTDVIMPNMNGQEVADAVKKSRPEIEVIFMSGYTDDVIAHHGVLDPGVNFIQKPITPSKLMNKLREVLEEK